jgi:hypothetical protein
VSICSADQDQLGDLIEIDRNRVGHGPQPVNALGYVAILDGDPLRDRHTGSRQENQVPEDTPKPWIIDACMRNRQLVDEIKQC